MKLEECEGFEWDTGNEIKNWLKHQVIQAECEEVFFNEPLIVSEDIKHSQKEIRYFALGRTNSDRELFLVFAVRKKLIRVISARDMSRKERKIYEQETCEITIQI